MGHCPDTIKRLIDRFKQQSDHIRSPDYNEPLIRIYFINPLMSELGWDIDNCQGLTMAVSSRSTLVGFTLVC